MRRRPKPRYIPPISSDNVVLHTYYRAKVVFTSSLPAVGVTGGRHGYDFASAPAACLLFPALPARLRRRPRQSPALPGRRLPCQGSAGRIRLAAPRAIAGRAVQRQPLGNLLTRV